MNKSGSINEAFALLPEPSCLPQTVTSGWNTEGFNRWVRVSLQGVPTGSMKFFNVFHLRCVKTRHWYWYCGLQVE